MLGSGSSDEGTDVVYTISIDPAKIGVSAAMFGTIGLLLLNNLLELHRALLGGGGGGGGGGDGGGGGGGGGAGDASAAKQPTQAEKKKSKLLERVRSMMAGQAAAV